MIVRNKFQQCKLNNHVKIPSGIGLNLGTFATNNDDKTGFFHNSIIYVAVIDMIKGVVGLCFGIYLSIAISLMMTDNQNFEDLSTKMEHSYFVFVFAFGATKWGVITCLISLLIWHLLLIVFGKILLDGVNQKNAFKLRLWFGYTLITTLLFLIPYIRLFLTNLNRRKIHYERKLFKNELIIWNILLFFYFLSFATTIYTMVMVKRFHNQITHHNHRRRRHVNDDQFTNPMGYY